MRIASLFSGAGMLDRAALQVFPDSEIVWHSEIDPAASKVLALHFPGVPNFGDVTQIDWAALEPVDVLTGGFPCQDVSAAGRRAGLGAGTRSGLWSHMCDAIEALRPRYVLIENVKGLLSAKAIRDVESQDDALGVDAPGRVLRAIGAVLGDLSDIGYDAEWTSVRASDVGAAHRRERVFILAFPANAGGARPQGRVGSESEEWSAADGGRRQLAGRGEQAATDADSDPVREQSESVPGSSSAALVELASEDAADAASLGRERFDDSAIGAAARPGWERVATGSAGRTTGVVGALLPTPSVADGTGGHVSRSGDRVDELLLGGIARAYTEGALLPTPRASDGAKGGPNQRGSGGDLMLPSAVHQLLPTPRTTDSHGAGEHGRGGADLRTTIGSLLPTPNAAECSGGGQHPDRRQGHSQQLIDYALLAGSQRWGDYEPAIRRQERLSRAAPSPTEPNTQGRPRLSAAFAQWLMFWPDNWVTDPALGLSRVSQLKIIGNGVCPPQAIAAFTHLLTREFDYAHP